MSEILFLYVILMHIHYIFIYSTYPNFYVLDSLWYKIDNYLMNYWVIFALIYINLTPIILLVQILLTLIIDYKYVK